MTRDGCSHYEQDYDISDHRVRPVYKVNLRVSNLPDLASLTLVETDKL